MKNSHFHFFLVFLIVGFGFLGYASYRTIDFKFSPSNSLVSAENINDTAAIDELSAPITVPAVVVPDTTIVGGVQTKPAVEATPTAAEPAPLSPERQKILGELEKLIKDDIRMKIGSSGTRVGTVQKFLNIYEKDSSKKVDNKYGSGLKQRVTDFQKAEGDEVDGLADPGTYQKMIDWLKQQ